MWPPHNSCMTHPLPLRPLLQRNPLWRLYGDTLLAIDATLAWPGGSGGRMTVRCLLSPGRPALPQRVSSTTVRFAAIPA